MTVISRVLGFVRDVVIAHQFGTRAGADAFFVAFRIPNLFRRLFAEGAFSQAFIPVLAEYKSAGDEAATRDLLDHVFGALGGVLLLFTAIGMIAAPLVVMIFAPGFIGNAEKYEITAAMLRITFPYLLFVSLTALAGGILNTWGRFGVPALTPVFLNISMIGAALWLAPRMEMPILALAWGVFAGGVVQFVFQIPFLARLRLLPRPRIRFGHEGVRRVMGLMLPAIFGSSITQINLLIDTLIASFLVTGSVSWLYYSDRMVEFPLGIFGIALATVMLPNLSRNHADQDTASFSASLDWALRWVLIIGAPASLGLAFLAGPILSTLFQYGEFGPHAVEMTRLSLIAYSIGLLGYILIKVLATAFYSRQDMRTPVRIGVVVMITNAVLNLSLVFTLEHVGLALATALAAYINATLLLNRLRKGGVYQPGPGWPALCMRTLAACLGMIALLLAGMGELTQWMSWGVMERAARLLALTGLGAASYFGVLWLSGWRWSHMTGPPTSV